MSRLVVPWPTDAVTSFCGSDDRITRVPRNPEFARQVIEGVANRECVHVLFAARRGDWIMAHTQSYDAARKSVEQLLLNEGWKVGTAGGGHAAVAELVQSWLGDAPDPGPRIAKRYQASMKARHSHEYPDPRDPTRTAKELRGLTLDNIRLMNLVRGTLGMIDRPDLVPTGENLTGFDDQAEVPE